MTMRGFCEPPSVDFPLMSISGVSPASTVWPMSSPGTLPLRDSTTVVFWVSAIASKFALPTEPVMSLLTIVPYPMVITSSIPMRSNCIVTLIMV